MTPGALNGSKIRSFTLVSCLNIVFYQVKPVNDKVRKLVCL